MAESTKLSQVTCLLTFVTSMGKGSVDEEAAYYGGLYAGGGTHPGVKEHVKSSDAVFWISNFPISLSHPNLLMMAEDLYSDFNTGEFTDAVAKTVIIEFQRFFVMVGLVRLDIQRMSDTLQIGSEKYDLKMRYVLRALVQSIEASSLARASIPKVTWDPHPLDNPEKGTKTTQDYLRAVCS